MLVCIESWLATHHFRRLTEVAIHTWIQLVGQLGIVRAGIDCIGVGHSGAVGIGCPSGTLVVKALIGPGSSLGVHGWVVLACSGILCVRVGGTERIVCSCTITISIKALLCHNDILSTCLTSSFVVGYSVPVAVVRYGLLDLVHEVRHAPLMNSQGSSEVFDNSESAQVPISWRAVFIDSLIYPEPMLHLHSLAFSRAIDAIDKWHVHAIATQRGWKPDSPFIVTRSMASGTVENKKLLLLAHCQRI